MTDPNQPQCLFDHLMELAHPAQDERIFRNFVTKELERVCKETWHSSIPQVVELSKHLCFEHSKVSRIGCSCDEPSKCTSNGCFLAEAKYAWNKIKDLK
jgi:hypothetical protein